MSDCDVNSLRRFIVRPLTWVVEGYQYEGARLPTAVSSVLDDGVSPEAGRCDLLKHAARGVHDKDQGRFLLDTEKSVEPQGGKDVLCISGIVKLLLNKGKTHRRKVSWPTVSLRSLSTLMVASLAK